jgi:hypothetical protein
VILLAKNGVPWDVALGWSPARRLAALIVIGEADGGKFDWAGLRMEFPTL